MARASAARADQETAWNVAGAAECAGWPGPRAMIGSDCGSRPVRPSNSVTWRGANRSIETECRSKPRSASWPNWDNTPVDRLLEQLAEAGMTFSGPDQVVTSAEKLPLGFLKPRARQGETMAEEETAPRQDHLARSARIPWRAARTGPRWTTCQRRDCRSHLRQQARHWPAASGRQVRRRARRSCASWRNRASATWPSSSAGRRTAAGRRNWRNPAAAGPGRRRARRGSGTGAQGR